MATEKKIQAVEELRDRIARCTIAIAADYSGLSVTQLVEARRAVREDGEFKVVKNRLFLRAAEAAGKPELGQLLEGPTAIIFGYDDIVGPAKAATEHMRTARNAFAVRKAVLDGDLLSLADVQSLASLPPRPILIGQIAGALQSPIAGLAGLIRNILVVPPGRLLNDSVQTFAGLLDARAKQLEGA